MSFQIQDYDYRLPSELIATEPIKPKTAAKMLCVPWLADGQPKNRPRFDDRHVADLPYCLKSGTVLVLNNTKVLPARIFGVRNTGGRHQILLIKEQRLGLWTALVHNSRKLKLQEKIWLENSVAGQKMSAELISKGQNGVCELYFEPQAELLAYLEQAGLAPLPPYLLKQRQHPKARAEDLKDYQTIFAKHYGAIAAPTAGLHLNLELLESLRQAGIKIVELTLHVGLGTFSKVEVEDVREHPMHSEDFFIPENTAKTINQAKQDGHKIVAVGTTVVRALEAAYHNGAVASGAGSTDLLISPKHSLQVIEGLLTNFHLPKSTLMVLVATLIGQSGLLSAYNHAIEQKYRFYSYGDCMLIT